MPFEQSVDLLFQLPKQCKIDLCITQNCYVQSVTPIGEVRLSVIYFGQTVNFYWILSTLQLGFSSLY